MFPHDKGRFYHDGRFKTLLDVVNSYDARFGLGLSDQEKHDLVEYLKSLQRLRASACSFGFCQEPAGVGDEIADFERFHQEWHVILFEERANFRLSQA